MSCCSPRKEPKADEAIEPKTASKDDKAAVEIQVDDPPKAPPKPAGPTAEEREAMERAALEAKKAADDYAAMLAAFEAAEADFKDACRKGLTEMLTDFAEGKEHIPRSPNKDENEMKRVMLERTFSKIDTNSDGELDRGEMRAMFTDLGMSLTEDEENEVLRQIDSNGSGTIDFEEFFQWYTRI